MKKNEYKFLRSRPSLIATRSSLLNSPRGFTILELIVSLAIIGLLLAVAINGLAVSRQKARDAKRVDEIKQIQNALQLYYNDNQSYPVTLSHNLLVPVYIKAIPKDPGTGNDYLYSAFLDGSTCGNYHLGARLEITPNNTGTLETDFDVPASGNVCAGSGADFNGADPVYDVHP